MRHLKKLLNLFMGRGPNSVGSFAAVSSARQRRQLGIHQPEGFNGILHSEQGETAIYTTGHSLLNQPASSELIAGRPRYLPDGISPPQEKLLYSMSDAGIVGSDGVVFCPVGRRAVEESLRVWTAAPEEHPSLSAPFLPPACLLPGRTLSLATVSAGGYYHFLIESLPRLWLAREHVSDMQQILSNGLPGSFHEKWLLLAGVDRAKIRWMAGLSHYRCEQLLFTNYLMRDYQPTAWIVSALHRLVDAVPPAKPGKRMLWISRSDALCRQPTWEKNLLAQLRGFEPVTLSGLDPMAQIALMRDAAVIAGPHGAGLSNIIFCAPGTKVCEIFPDANRQPIYGRLANVCHLPYAWAIADYNRQLDITLAHQILRWIG